MLKVVLEPQTKESIRFNAPLQYHHKTEQLQQVIMKQKF